VKKVKVITYISLCECFLRWKLTSL